LRGGSVFGGLRIGRIIYDIVDDDASPSWLFHVKGGGGGEGRQRRGGGRGGQEKEEGTTAHSYWRRLTSCIPRLYTHVAIVNAYVIERGMRWWGGMKTGEGANATTMMMFTMGRETRGGGMVTTMAGGGRWPYYLPQWLIDRAALLGYVRPTLLQKRALDVLLPSYSRKCDAASVADDDDDDVPIRDDSNDRNGMDAVLHGQTGSGKTLAYLLPLMGCIDPNKCVTQAIVVVPMRELGHQVVRVACRLGAGIVGGGDIDDNDDDDVQK
jgi:hypothetical protein